jgi:hypothetical protein
VFEGIEVDNFCVEGIEVDNFCVEGIEVDNFCVEGRLILFKRVRIFFWRG